VGIAAASRAGSRVGEAYMHNVISDTYYELGRYDESMASSQALLDIARDIGNRLAEAAAYASLAQFGRITGDFERDCEYLNRALDIYVEMDTPAYQSAMLANIGERFNSMGRYAEAVEYLNRSREALHRAGSDRGGNELAAMFGMAYAGLNRHDEALTHLGEALRLDRAGGFRQQEAVHLRYAADSLAALGDRAAARRYLVDALDILTDLGSPQAEEVRRRLDALADSH
jgi:tetratricopeptide (TPR) repeat protein